MLAQGQSRLTVASPRRSRVRDGIGQLWHLAAGPQTFGPGLRIKTTRRPAAAAAARPAHVPPGSSPLRFGDRPYRGQVQVSVANGALRAVNVRRARGLPLRRRPVGDAARLAAGGAQGPGRRGALLRARGQARAGPGSTSTRTRGARSISASPTRRPRRPLPCRTTAGQVVIYAGRVATTYFFSSSGGRTSSASEVWPGSTGAPYLVSVNDPYDTISPYHRWGPFVVPAPRLRRVLGVRGRLTDVTHADRPVRPRPERDRGRLTG